MYAFEMEVKQVYERHEEMVRELQLERQLPRKAQANPFLNTLNAVKAVFLPRAIGPVRTTTRHSLATK